VPKDATRTDGATIWEDYKRHARIIILDALLFLTVIAFLLIVFAFLKVLEVAGYSKERLELLENIHSIGSAGVIVVFGFDMFMKAISLLGRDR
jgi:hypothetical protein